MQVEMEKSDLVLWQKPIYQQKIQKAKWQHKNANKNFCLCDYLGPT